MLVGLSTRASSAIQKYGTRHIFDLNYQLARAIPTALREPIPYLSFSSMVLYSWKAVWEVRRRVGTASANPILPALPAHTTRPSRADSHFRSVFHTSRTFAVSGEGRCAEDRKAVKSPKDKSPKGNLGSGLEKSDTIAPPHSLCLPPVNGLEAPSVISCILFVVSLPVAIMERCKVLVDILRKLTCSDE